MKRLWLLFLLLILAAPVFSQTTSTASRIIYKSSLPATCNPSLGDIYFKTQAPNLGPYYCSASNTWTYWLAAGVSGPWSGLTGPSTNLGLAMAANVSTFTWNSATGSNKSLFRLTDGASNTGTGCLFCVDTASASAMTPIQFTVKGTTNGVKLDPADGIFKSIGTGGVWATGLLTTTVTALQGNGTKVQMSTGTTTTGHLTSYDANGNAIDSGLTLTGNGTKVATVTGATTSGNVVVFDASGNAVAGGFSIASLSGNTTKAGTVSGTLTSGNITRFDASGNIIDAGIAATSVAQLASPIFTGILTAPNVTISSITGLTQCIHANSAGVLSGTGQDCGAGGGGGTGNVSTAVTLTNNNLSLGAGTTTLKSSDVSYSSPTLTLPVGGILASQDTGTPKFTFGSSLITSNVPLQIGGGTYVFNGTGSNAAGVIHDDGSGNMSSSKVVVGDLSSVQGTGTKVQVSTGSVSTNTLTKFDSNGNTVNSGITDDATTITTTEYLDLHSGKYRFPETVVGSLPSASSNTGKVYVVTDGTSSSDCTSGSGSSRSLCTSNGTSWVALGGGGGGGGGNPAGYSRTMLANRALASANTYYEVLNIPSIPAGSYLMTSSINLKNTTNAAVAVTCKLWDGSTVFSSAETTLPANGGSGATYGKVTMTTQASPSGTITAAVTCAPTAGSSAVTALAAAGDNSAGNNVSNLNATALSGVTTPAISVAVSCSPNTGSAGTSSTCTATVTNDIGSQGVTWSAPACGSKSGDTSTQTTWDTTGCAGANTITATAVADTSKTGNGTFTVSGGGGIAVSLVTPSPNPCFTSGATTTLTCTFSATTSGATIVVFFQYLDATPSDTVTIQDSASNTYTMFASACKPHGSPFSGWSCQYSFKPSGSITSITATWPSNFQNAQMKIVQITGITGTQDVGAYAQSGGGTSYSSTATGTLHQSSEACIGSSYVSGNVTYTPTSYTNLSTQYDGSIDSYNVAYFLTAATTGQSYDGTISTSAFAPTQVGCYY
jgi:hypothetical protein